MNTLISIEYEARQHADDILRDAQRQRLARIASPRSTRSFTAWLANVLHRLNTSHNTPKSVPPMSKSPVMR